MFTAGLRNCRNFSSVKTQVAANKFVAYIHGTPEQPLCHKSSIIVAALKHYDQPFLAVDIQGDQSLQNELLATYSFLPQVYKDGKVLGGAYTLLELQRNGTLQKTLT